MAVSVGDIPKSAPKGYTAESRVCHTDADKGQTTQHDEKRNHCQNEAEHHSGQKGILHKLKAEHINHGLDACDNRLHIYHHGQ